MTSTAAWQPPPLSPTSTAVEEPTLTWEELHGLCGHLASPDRYERFGNGIHLPAPVSLAEDDAYASRFIHFLQLAAGSGIPVVWTCTSLPQCDLASITHLPPPAEAASASCAGAVREWRERYRLGSFYYRRGPGFYQIRDARGPRAVRLRVDGPESCRAFQRLTAPVHADDLWAGNTTMIDQLGSRNLLVRIGAWSLVAPYRLRDWPVPYTTI